MTHRHRCNCADCQKNPVDAPFVMISIDGEHTLQDTCAIYLQRGIEKGREIRFVPATVLDYFRDLAFAKGADDVTLAERDGLCANPSCEGNVTEATIRVYGKDYRLCCVCTDAAMVAESKWHGFCVTGQRKQEVREFRNETLTAQLTAMLLGKPVAAPAAKPDKLAEKPTSTASAVDPFEGFGHKFDYLLNHGLPADELLAARREAFANKKLSLVDAIKRQPHGTEALNKARETKNEHSAVA